MDGARDLTVFASSHLPQTSNLLIHSISTIVRSHRSTHTKTIPHPHTSCQPPVLNLPGRKRGIKEGNAGGNLNGYLIVYKCEQFLSESVSVFIAPFLAQELNDRVCTRKERVTVAPD